jgi:16S rRNA C967 or C1407 C5-methylase (RsmB/RsmF family)
MGRQSSIDRLPEDIREQLQELLRDPRVTQLDATARINEILAVEGHEERVTKSAVNRYDLSMREAGEKLRQSREVAKMWIGKLGAAPAGQVGHLVNEILRTLAFDLSLKLQDAELNEESLPGVISQVKALALAVQRLEASSTMNVKREAEIRKQTLEKAAEAIGETAREAGVSAETIARIRRDVLRMSA